MPISMPYFIRRFRWGHLALPLGLVSSVGCQGDHLTPTTALVDPAELYWSLELSHHAVTLSTTAPYDTLTVAATPKNYAGESLAGTPVYTTTDPRAVVVTPTGVLIAVAPTVPFQPVVVYATMTIGNLKHSDTMY